MEGLPFGAALVVRGAAERLSPIPMTVLTTDLALAPIMATGDLPGKEIEHRTGRRGAGRVRIGVEETELAFGTGD